MFETNKKAVLKRTASGASKGTRKAAGGSPADGIANFAARIAKTRHPGGRVRNQTKKQFVYELQVAPPRGLEPLIPAVRGRRPDR